MEANTVLLSVEDYNELRDFKKEIEKGNIFTIKMNYDWLGFNYGNEILFYTKEESILLLEKEIRELGQRIKDMNTPTEEMPIKDIKKMSYWEFRKWRKS